MTQQPAPLGAPGAGHPTTQPGAYPSPSYAPEQYAVGQHPSEPYPSGRGPTPMTPADEVTWSTVAHLSWLAGSFVGLPFLAPLVLFLVFKDRGPFVRHHGTEALNFQLSLLAYGLAIGVVGGILTLLTLGLLAPVLVVAAGALVVAGIVFTIIAAIAAGKGEWYRYPLTIRFVS